MNAHQALIRSRGRLATKYEVTESEWKRNQGTPTGDKLFERMNAYHDAIAIIDAETAAAR